MGSSPPAEGVVPSCVDPRRDTAPIHFPELPPTRSPIVHLRGLPGHRDPRGPLGSSATGRGASQGCLRPSCPRERGLFGVSPPLRRARRVSMRGTQSAWKQNRAELPDPEGDRFPSWLISFTTTGPAPRGSMCPSSLTLRPQIPDAAKSRGNTFSSTSCRLCPLFLRPRTVPAASPPRTAVPRACVEHLQLLAPRRPTSWGVRALWGPAPDAEEPGKHPNQASGPGVPAAVPSFPHPKSIHSTPSGTVPHAYHARPTAMRPAGPWAVRRGGL